MAMNITAAYAVHESSQVAGPRRAATDLAGRSGFSEERAGKVALVVTELATNLTKHATGGEMLLRSIRGTDGGTDLRGIEILAIDRGPGVRDVSGAREDGYSTAGSLGHGLGSIERQSDFFQIYTQPSGTIVLARLWSEKPGVVARKPPFEIGAVLVSHPGEDICGDGWDWTMRDDRFAILVADGLGHGFSAHEASRGKITVACDYRSARRLASNERRRSRHGRGRHQSRSRKLLRHR
jgi:anti-sigma regulatory factor (Ser/Thr protein kinase)